MEAPKVLIVEDSVEMADLLAITLQDDQIETETAVTGESALAKLREVPFDLVLLDLGLPDIDGMEVLDRMRRDPQLSQVPVIIITGREKMADKVRAFDLGAADYINKPINFLDVQARIMANLRRRRTQRETSSARRTADRTREELARISQAMDSTSDAVCLTDDLGRVVYVNQSFVTLFGHDLDGLQVKEMHRRLFHRDNAWDEIWGVCKELGSWRGEVEMKNAEDEAVVAHCRVDPVLGEQRNFLGVMAIYTDIRQRKRLEEDLVFLANHDALTGLHNRRHFTERLKAAAATATAARPVYLLYCDLDRFKVINHLLDHSAGDRYLTELAAVFRQKARPETELARMGGDEFGLIVRVVSEADALALGRELCQLVATMRFTEGARSFACTASVGIAAVDGNLAAEEVLARAISACFQIKTGGGNGVDLHRPDNHTLQGLIEDANCFLRVQEALAEKRLEVWLQPILAVKPGGVNYFEALVRMRDEHNRVVQPDRFLPAAERFGILHEVDQHVLYRVVNLLREQPLLRISMNLSARMLISARLPEMVAGLLKEMRLQADRLMFEVTETTAIQNLDRAREVMGALRKLGCRFALDDFGRGVSSLLYLRDLPVDLIKIDGAFVGNLEKDEVNRAIVRSVNEIAHLMKRQTVAEYVSSAGVLQAVRGLGVDYAQGWHVFEPAPPEHFFKIGLENIALPRA